jgi:hypothetical protein
LEQVENAETFHGYTDLVRVNGGVVAEPKRALASRDIRAAECSLHKLDALGDGATHTVHAGEDIVDVDPGAVSHPNATLGRVIDGELINSAGEGARKGQIRSETLKAFRL